MTKSTAAGKTQSAAKGPGPKSSKRDESGEKKHLIVPAIDLGGGDEDEEDDDFRPGGGFVLPAPPKPAVAVPPQQRDDVPAASREEELPETVATGAVAAAESTFSGGSNLDPQRPSTASFEAEETDRSAGGAVQSAPGGTAPAVTHTEDVLSQSAPAARTVERETGGAAAQPAAGERSSDLARTERPASAPAVLRGSSSLSGLPARRPGRRRSAEPFNADAPRQRNEAAMAELAENSPGYANLLTVYSASQLQSLPFENRNINLYGLTADQAGTQITADKALLKTLTLQRPKLTIAHYIDAAMEPVLRPLDPLGIDMDDMETERDYVWELAQKGLAYRRYILSDQESASMKNYRPVCSLRTEVNARLTRMMDLMDSIQDIQAKPFEIVSACVAEFLGRLPDERPHLASFFQRHLVTTIQ
ncbi:hypothetical protein [Streptomyces sp. bgisy060]|uniref:hypothetical protein n=1 Tax=Streptomyces sp. bgisy060 TaxID=3413775 RepID=UPI003EBC144D